MPFPSFPRPSSALTAAIHQSWLAQFAPRRELKSALMLPPELFNTLQLSVDYSDCAANCEKEFTVATEQTGPFMIYYGVSGFWQNHRRYWKSKEDKQLLGDLDDQGDCAPFTKVG